MGVNFDARILLRRGTAAEFEANKSNIKAGEPAIATDEGRLFIGVADGQAVEFARKDEVIAVENIINAVNAEVDQAKIVITENTAAIRTLESTLADANPNGEPRVSVTTAAAALTLPKNAAPAPLRVTLRGMTATNLVTNGGFDADVSGWDYVFSKAAWVNGRAYFKHTDTIVTLQQNIAGISPGDKIYVSLDVETVTTGTANYGVWNNNGDPPILFYLHTLPAGKTRLSGVFTVANWQYLYINSRLGAEFYIDNVLIVNLTQTFGAGNEPSKSVCDALFGFFDSTKSAVAPRLKSVDADGENPTYLYCEPYTLRRADTGEYDEIVDGKLIRRVDDVGTALVEPEIIENVTSGTLISYPQGTIYAEPVLADAGIYDSGISVFREDFPIAELETVYKVDFITGEKVPLDVEDALIAVDGLSFTHDGLTDGDIVFFTYYYEPSGVNSINTYGYLDSRHVVADTANGKYYTYKPVITNGAISGWTITEV